MSKPHCCPVCIGRGSVPAGFYGLGTALLAEVCRACSGSGIIWEIEWPAAPAIPPDSEGPRTISYPENS
jgi:DnaJ-class molecular chaperone